ncbi:Hypothetical protein PHPALM_20834 [Phytophthora palmivora]|uniref:Uncharacterized protein n=1 Tax=Phytophthora palmivora TaxID=4796 RepID=A0A2P4XDW4_9STRA|nr:Hypothetical protein PHPALM_20834 [Phytophthora palmivora]
MGDAAKEQLNAVDHDFVDSTFTFLMRTRGLPNDDAALVYKDVYDLRFTANAGECTAHKKRAVKQADPQYVPPFNRAKKRDYTQRQQLKMSVLIHQLLACCNHRLMSLPKF